MISVRTATVEKWFRTSGLGFWSLEFGDEGDFFDEIKDFLEERKKEFKTRFSVYFASKAGMKIPFSRYYGHPLVDVHGFPAKPG